MESEEIDWEQDLPLDADEAYRSLVRSLKRTDGFSLLFVRCSPIQGKQIITDVGNDLKDKNIKILELEESIDNLYDRIAAIDDLDRLNILFIKGIEQSIFAYEDREAHDINLRSRSLQYGGTWQNVPRVLGHLNLSRERFRDNFKFCIVFLLPEFALRYFIRRAPDFFDWRSNIYDFPTEKSLVDQESYRLVYLDGSLDEYRQLSNEQRIAKQCQIKSYIDESSDPKRTSELWFEKGLIHAAAKEYEEAITSYDKALQIKPDYHEAWYNRGIALGNLGRVEEAIASYDRTVEIKPDEQDSWYNRGIALGILGRNEEAIASYDRAVEIKPDYHQAWVNRGISLRKLGRYEEAIASYDRAVEIKPDYHEAWFNRSISLRKLGRYEEAIASYDK
ncbi:MAG: tetratricopeptide repeat protein [Microcystis aeruginosa G11-01]|nr:tetratricopeptide repeat protein [Microcystis aeruginosa G11-01]